MNSTDDDLGVNAAVIYTLAGPDDAYFTIGPSSGTLRVTHVFDYETHDTFYCQVVATDLGVPALSSSTFIQISIIDINDQSPEFNQTTYEFLVVENQMNTTSVIGTVHAVDGDTDLFSNFAYSISQSDLFYIHPRSGDVTVLVPLDREINPFYYLNVYATDTTPGVKPLLGTSFVVVRIVDVNDNRPVINFPRSTNNTVYMSSQIPAGYIFMRIKASDLDEGVNAELVYTLKGGDRGNLFSIDYNTGVISTATPLRKHNNEIITIEIEVTDRGVPDSHRTTGWVEVHVNDSALYDSQESKDDKVLQAYGQNTIQFYLN